MNGLTTSWRKVDAAGPRAGLESSLPFNLPLLVVQASTSRTASARVTRWPGETNTGLTLVRVRSTTPIVSSRSISGTLAPFPGGTGS